MNKFSIALLGLFATPALAQQGAWEVPSFDFGPSFQQRIVAVHLIHVFDGTQGKVVAFTFVDSQTQGQECDPGCSSTCVGKIYFWTPPPADSPGNPGDFETIPNCHNYVFCAGHSALADGRILVAGSEWAYFNNTSPFADLFDPNFWSTGAPVWNSPQPPNMAQGRWYPTCTTLADGKVLVTS